MADIIDTAQALEAWHREAALRRQQLAEPTLSHSHCEDCGAAISEARRQAAKGCTRCIDCQTEHEAWGWVR